MHKRSTTGWYLEKNGENRVDDRIRYRLSLLFCYSFNKEKDIVGDRRGNFNYFFTAQKILVPIFTAYGSIS